MACAIKKSMCKRSSNNKPPKENRQIVNCKQQSRKLRQEVARASNKTHCRKSKQKLTKNRAQYYKDATQASKFKERKGEYQLKLTKEKWLNKMSAKKMKLQKIAQKE